MAFRQLSSEFITGSVAKGVIFPSKEEETEVLRFLSTRKNSGQSELNPRP